MSTENENWREDSERENSNYDDQRGTSRDGNRAYNRDGYNRRDDNRSSFNRENNYNREGYQNRSYGDRQSRPSYNRYDNNNSDRPNYNRGDRPQRSYNREDGGDRPYRPRFNREGGDNRQSNYNRGDRPQRSYNQDRPSWGNNDNRSWNNNSGEGGERPRFRKPSDGNSYGNSYGNTREDGRPRRPRFTPGGGGGRPQGFQRPTRRYNDGYDPNSKYSKKKQIEYKEQFVDPNEPIRLNKFLANAGVCSRREADEFITAGVVSVNGEVVKELGTKIKRADEVKFHDQLVSIERKIYILLNKPKDTVTTSDDPQDRRTVMDLVKNACSERIYPVGRLDRNTTGVLLLTNDGDLASKLTHPKYLKKKIYQVQTDKNVAKSDLDQIMAGIKLEEEEEIRADDVSYIDDASRKKIGIEIHSGQNRIVRRIFESLGYKVVKLDRVYFAGLTKKGLRRGDWRYLTEQEVNFLRMGSFE